MFSRILQSTRTAPLARSFSASAVSRYDVARLTLIGRLARDVEFKETKTGKEYATYVVGTTNYPPPAVGADGIRPDSTVSWHRVVSFQPSSLNYLRTLEKGSLVFVEANYEVREPVKDAEPGSLDAQRNIFLRQESIRLLKRPAPPSS
ncbi:hypothetical protein DL93DRAFT_2072150 [Clavulina sp. PMI_390]|nr:hypothetical protein DL93DRAFT_2072150 [Clavulina sp. PMI_390]